MNLILIIVLIVLVAGGIGTYPRAGYYQNWEPENRYVPSGGFALLLIAVLLLWYFGVLPR